MQRLCKVFGECVFSSFNTCILLMVTDKKLVTKSTDWIYKILYLVIGSLAHIFWSLRSESHDVMFNIMYAEITLGCQLALLYLWCDYWQENIKHCLLLAIFDWTSYFLQVLDNEFTDENRRRCAEAARPLVSAVEELTTFACSPEFASVPAKISHPVSSWRISISPTLPHSLKTELFESSYCFCSLFFCNSVSYQIPLIELEI